MLCLVFILLIPVRSPGQRIKNPDALLELTRQKAKQTDSLLKRIEEDNQLMVKYILLLFSNPPKKPIYDPGIYTVDEKGVYGDHGHRGQTSVWFKGKLGQLPEEVIKQVQVTESMEKRYKELKKDHSYMRWTYMITAEGVIRVYPRDAKAKYPADSDSREMAAYILAGQEKNPRRQTIWTEPYKKDAEEEWMVTCSTLIYQEGTFLGVQALDITIDELKDKVLKVKAGRHSLALLIDKKGNILARTDPSKGRKNQEETFNYTNLADIPGDPLQGIIEKMGEGREGVIKFTMGEQVKYLAFAPVKTTGWIYGIIAKI